MGKYENFSLHYTPFTFEQKDDFIKKTCENIPFKKSNKKISFANVACSFDIETTSFYYSSQQEKLKGACMYIWQFGINGYVIYGREWTEFIDLLKTIAEKLGLYDKRRLVCYVHNLGYEFQFMCKWIEWNSIFAKDIRKPLYCLSEWGIEFRCSYYLSAYSLQKVGEHLQKYKVKKLVGYLDYEKLRHSKTVLTENEIAYCVNDVLVVMAYIQEYIEREGYISNLPLTNTGVVRKFCKNYCIRSKGKSVKKYEEYRRIMAGLTVDGETEYKQLKRAFQGGFTHANAYKAGIIIKNVHSFDFTSSYPFTMLSEKFPMSKGKLVNIKSVDDLKKYLNLYCCIFDLTLYNVNPILTFENPISREKCYQCENPIINNGRIVTADKITITLTEIDFYIIKQFYSWSKAEIFNCRIYEKNYLPKNFILSILELYRNKTELKGIEGKEVEYMVSKNMLNSSYGMSVTDIVHDNITFDDEWHKEKGDAEKEISKYNISKNRFLFYPWGVYVTAYARKNLFTGILECNNDYIYADTDSIKFTNLEKHENYFVRYNNYVLDKLKQAAKYHDLDFNLFTPKNKHGEVKIIGIWEYEGCYKRFKTLGAKRYLTDTGDKIQITVAGVNKKTANDYLLKTYGEKKIFSAFNDLMYIPADYTGKLTHTYFDDELEIMLEDYNGVKSRIYEKSYTHLEKAEFTLSITSQYLDFMKGVKISED